MIRLLLSVVFFVTLGCALPSQKDFSPRNLESAPGIFWNGLSDEGFLKEIESAENEMRIFIYPIPEDQDTLSRLSKISSMGHFQSESWNNAYAGYRYLFVEYLQHFAKLGESSEDARARMFVSDPEKANIFFINHEWMRYTKHNCPGALDHHMTKVINNVVDNYPYYNRSQGRDHFIMAAYDHGPFCDMECSHRSKNPGIVFRITGASFIGNYGMDKQTFFEGNSTVLKDKYKRFGYPCHRAGQDIVIPQLMLSATRDTHQEFVSSRIPYREFDSTFSGSNWGERAPAKEMSFTANIDYKYNGTEKFGFYIEGGSPDHSLKYRGYFMYNPCGNACWSQRLYESLAVFTVPIIVTDGGIQPFERFIDWRAFTLKLTLDKWFNKTALYEVRRQIRHEAEDFRTKLLSCWSKLGITFDSSVGLTIFSSLQHDSKWVEKGLSGEVKECSLALKTLYWRKTDAIKRVVPWLDFTDTKTTKINAFRLITLDMWCHMREYIKKIPEICNRPVDYTARISYLDR